MASPLLDQMKLQAKVLVPLLRAFRAEFGAERVNALAWRVLAEWRREMVKELHPTITERGAAGWMTALTESTERIGDAIDFQFLKQEPQALDFNVTGCRFARLFRELGEPELGFALLCSMDDTVTEELGAGEVELKRTGTIMQGATHCDFRYALKKAGMPTT